MNSLVIKTILVIYVSTLPDTYLFNGDEADCVASRASVTIDGTSNDRCTMNSTVFVTKHITHTDGTTSTVFAGSVFVEGKCDDYQWLYTNDPVKCHLFSPKKEPELARIEISVYTIVVAFFGFVCGFACMVCTGYKRKIILDTVRDTQQSKPPPPPTTTHHLATATPPAKQPQTPVPPKVDDNKA